jgi:hypothetical protein
MMGGIPPSEAKRLTYWEFTAMRHTWNERHKRPGDDTTPATPPSEADVREAQAELYELGIAGRSPS